MSFLTVILYVFIVVERGIPEYIIYSTNDGIYRYDLQEERPHTKLYTLNVWHLNIEFEYSTNCIIFDNDNDKSLQRFCLSDDNNTVETITNYTGYSSVCSIAYDWVGENIFWTTVGPSQILVARRKGSNERVLFDETHLDYPLGLALDPHRGWMYWTDESSSNTRIVRAQMDGDKSTYQVLVQGHSNVLWPSFLTLDHQFENMYWTDWYLNRVMKASVTGENLEIIASGDDVSAPLGIGIHKTILYWGDFNKRAIFYTDVRPDRRKVQMLVGNISGIDDLKVVSRHTQTLNVEFSAWSAWGSCSKTCGSGTKTRTRSCDNPVPSNGGGACCGDSLQKDICNTQDCQTGTNKEMIIGIAIGAGSSIAVVIIIVLIICLAKKRKCPGICCKRIKQENEHQYEASTPTVENQHVYMELVTQHSNPENVHDYISVV